MSANYPSNYDLKGVVDNYLSRLIALEREVKLLKGEDINTESISDISDDLGTMRSGRFIAAQSGTDLDNDANGNPTLGNLTGSAMLWPGVVISGVTYTIIGANNGTLEFGLSAVDGTAVFAAGAGVINSTGIIMTGLYYPLQFNATNAGVTRIGLNGMFLPSGATTPSYQFAYQSPSGPNLVLNGDAELGALTNWTDVFSSSAWAASTINPFAGTYSFRALRTVNLITNGDAETGTKTGWTDASTAWTAYTTNPYQGIYSFRHDPTNAGCPAQLVQNVSGLTAGNIYEIVFASLRNSGAFTPHINIVWKTAGAAVISTVRVNGNATNSWALTYSGYLTAPATATNADIQLDAGDTFTDTQFDNIVFAPVAQLRQNIGSLTAGQNYLFSFVSLKNSGPTNPIVSVVWKTSGAAVIRTDTITGSSGGWSQNQKSLNAPATATNADVILDPQDIFTDAQFDNISLATQSVAESLYFDDGGLWFQDKNSMLERADGGVILSTGLAQFSNTAAEQTFFSFTLPGGFLGTGSAVVGGVGAPANVIEFWIRAGVSNTTGAALTITHKFYYNTATIILNANTINTGTNIEYWIHIILVGQGATNAQQLVAEYFSLGQNTALQSINGSLDQYGLTTDSTTAQTIKFTQTMSVANANATAFIRYANVRAVRGT